MSTDMHQTVFTILSILTSLHSLRETAKLRGNGKGSSQLKTTSSQTNNFLTATGKY